MEFDFERFAELEFEREKKETFKSLEAMDDQEFISVITDSLQKMVNDSIELNRLEKEAEKVAYRFDEEKIFVDNYLDPICQDRWGHSIYDLDVQLQREDELLEIEGDEEYEDEV